MATAVSTLQISRDKAAARIVAPGEVWPILVGAFGATIIQASLLWDMSWHFSVGRDTFWTPPHVGIYAGTTLAALIAAWLLIRSTRTSAAAAGQSRWVEVLGFQAPSGAWVILLGAGAMGAGGFFDSWWHRVYGLDVTVLSPAHVVLFFFGMAFLQAGFWFLARVAISNSASTSPLLYHLADWLAGTQVLVLAVLSTEQTFMTYMHNARFWFTIALVFPALLVGFRIPGRRWSATRAAAWYTVMRLGAVWILPLFEAAPQLGPVYTPVTHMVPPDFPLLLIVPAIAIDLISQRELPRRPWAAAVALGTAFLAAMLLVQWPFAGFLLSDAARTPFFAADNFRYNLSPNTFTVRGEFFPEPAWYLVVGLLGALAAAILSARAGLAWNRWAGSLRR